MAESDLTKQAKLLDGFLYKTKFPNIFTIRQITPSLRTLQPAGLETKLAAVTTNFKIIADHSYHV